MIIYAALISLSLLAQASDWCRNLGSKECVVDPHSKSASSILSDIEAMDISELVSKSRKLADITFIPKDRLKQAKLPKSGVRVIVDCNGRHLQLRGDLLPADQIDFFKKNFKTIR